MQILCNKLPAQFKPKLARLAQIAVKITGNATISRATLKDFALKRTGGFQAQNLGFRMLECMQNWYIIGMFLVIAKG